MNLLDKVKKYKDYIVLYFLIWAVGALFYILTTDKSIFDILQRQLLIMFVDAPAVFIMTLKIFPKYLRLDKIAHLIIAVAIVNLVTLLIYGGFYELLGFSKFKFNFWDLPFDELSVQFLVKGFRQSIHTVFFASLMIGMQYIEFRQKFLKAEKDKAQAEVKLLKSQIDPHFLFNNLNILSSLIKKDSDQADVFVTRFSNLYRYMLSHGDKDFVMLSEELRFLDDYIFLLKNRFGNAYSIEQQITSEQAEGYVILPTALQGLVENAVKHNQGSRNEPLVIKMEINGEHLIVTNPNRPKMTKSPSTGTGLKNLSSRYELMVGQLVKIEENTEQFTIKIPLIKYYNPV